MTWILGSFRKDVLWLYFPGLAALLLSFFILRPSPTTAFWIYTFVALQFFDSGHVYTTLWRTYLNPEERRRRQAYVYAPLFFFLLFWVWGYFQIPGLAACIIYATIFHNVRQFFGIHKWYQRLNGNYVKWADYLLYFNCFMPFLIAHFRTGPVWNYDYSDQDIFRFPNEDIYKTLLVFYFIGVTLWLVFETLRLKKNREWNRVLSAVFPTVLYGVCFLCGRTAAEIVFPLVIAHGVSYFALMSLALSRTQKRFSNLQFGTAVVLMTALLFGSLEGVFEEYYLDLTSVTLSPLVALYLTPLFCHYYFDAFLWKKTHPESPQVYSAKVLS
ncbi:hypothetical protein [uncultured Bdellovibrio sp.]|uniref:hypothetical protein n=1 Tax=Bdellovibrio sp. HCB-162 TaxID=3394234 RepID=UPI0025ED5E9B|nr:hypothetical protein [uncultured Bdellovibrio sp.]